MSHYFLYSQNKHSKNRRFFQYMDFDFVAANFFKKESRSPRGFLPRPLLRAGESVAPPPLPQKNSGGAHQEFRSKKVRANAKITPPNETLSELRKRSDFAEAKIALSIFSKPFPPTAEAVNSQSSPQLKS
jgi:hypothetical protein